MSRLVNDLRDVVELAHHGPEDLFISAVMLIGSFILLIRVELKLNSNSIFLHTLNNWIYHVKRGSKMENAFRKVRRKLQI